MDTIKKQKKKDRSASALVLGSSSQGKELAAKGPVPGESLDQGRASWTLDFLGLFLECELRQN